MAVDWYMILSHGNFSRKRMQFSPAFDNEVLSIYDAEQIATRIENSEQLEYIFFNRNIWRGSTKETIVTAVGQNTSLEHIEIINNNLGDNHAAEIAKAIGNNKSLKVVDISKNNITEVGAEHIATALETNTSLQVLDLSHNNINKVGAIATALETNTSLRRLNLSKNNITEFGTIANTLKTNTSLQVLDLSNNNITEVRAIADVLKTNKSLTWLYLSNNNITEVGAIAEALKTNKSLTRLDLSKNKITKDCVAKIATALETNTTIRTIKLNYPKNSDKKNKEQINKFLKRNNKMFALKNKKPTFIERIKKMLGVSKTSQKETSLPKEETSSPDTTTHDSHEVMRQGLSENPEQPAPTQTKSTQTEPTPPVDENGPAWEKAKPARTQFIGVHREPHDEAKADEEKKEDTTPKPGKR